MTIEEKARAYDKAIEKIKYVMEHGVSPVLNKEDLQDIFPELAESEDERIRREIIDFLWKEKIFLQEAHLSVENSPKYRFVMDAIAWLEKQGEQNLNSCDGCINRKGCINCENGDMKETEHKVEPKFHEMEWITNGDYTWQIVSATDLDYILQSQDGNTVDDTISHVDEQFHSFTIQDVKDGDVLVYNNSSVEIILLFKRWMDGIGEGAYSYVHTFKNEILFNDWSDCGYATRPATKEQCELLFQKIKEAGYEWNEGKKELRKIEKQAPKSKWSDDEQYLLVCKNALRKYQVSDKWDADIISKWLEDIIKQREQKPKWSEEDDKRQISIIEYLNELYDDNRFSLNELTDLETWLNSLKQRMEE